jgi:hypothetical protein
MSYWFEKCIVEVKAIFQSVLVIFSNSAIEWFVFSTENKPSYDTLDDKAEEWS